MMRYQRVASPDFLGQISSFPSSSSSSDVKPLRVGSGSTNPIQTETHSLPTKNPKSQSNNDENNKGGKLLLQWGQKKRSRNFIKVQRRAAIAGEVKVAAVTASGSLPPCVNLRIHHHKRNVEERSNGQSRPEIRSPPSIGVGPDGPSPVKPDPKPPVEEEKVKLGWPRIYVTLSRKEKEDDFLAMKGSKLPQRPKKRGKNIDKALQYCYPGMWLSDLTRGRYEVREKRCAKKKRRGLKGMESMDSDSE